jgi:hypothetical protein
MKIDLTEEQSTKIAIEWIENKGRTDFKEVIYALFKSRHMATWSWMDALHYAVTLCSKEYCTKVSCILRSLKRSAAKEIEREKLS